LSWWLIALLAWLAPGVLVSLALLWTAWLQPALRGSRGALMETGASAESVTVAAEPAAELPQPEDLFVPVPVLSDMRGSSIPPPICNACQAWRRAVRPEWRSKRRPAG
jgi:hypothetical protein